MNWSNIVKKPPSNIEDTKPITRVKSQQSITDTEIVDYETLFNLYHNTTIEDLFFDFKNEMEQKCLPIINTQNNPFLYQDFYKMISENTYAEFTYLNDNSDVEDDEDYLID